MNIARSWRKVDKEEIEFSPVGFKNELVKCFRSHRSTPYYCLIGIGKESDREDFHTVVFDRLDERFAIDSHRLRSVTCYIKHYGDRGSIDIGIEDTYFEAHFGESGSQVGSYSALTYPTFTRGNSDNILDTRNGFSFDFGYFGGDDFYIYHYFGFFVNFAVNSFHYFDFGAFFGLQTGIVDNYIYYYFVAKYYYILDSAAIDHIFSFTRSGNFAKRF